MQFFWFGFIRVPFKILALLSIDSVTPVGMITSPTLFQMCQERPQDGCPPDNGQSKLNSIGDFREGFGFIAYKASLQWPKTKVGGA